MTPEQIEKFQSLFCWMLFWKFLAEVAKCTPKKVSILILLDVILEDDNTFVAIELSFRFNPYFVGCYSGRKSLSDQSKNLCVSILILLDVILEVVVVSINLTC